MALSNIFREPRRELTESVIGIVIIATLVYADYRFGLWFEQLCGYEHWKFSSGSITSANVPWPAGMFIGLLLVLALFSLGLFSHFIGEEIADKLERRGIHLRPRVRR